MKKAFVVIFFWASFLVPAICVSSIASAAVKFSLIGGAVNSKPAVVNITTSYAAKLSYGGGFLFEIMMGKRVGFELGGLYLLRKFDATANSSTVTFESQIIQVPAVFRFHLSRVFSLGLGGFASSGIGNVKATAAGTSVNQSYGNSGIKNLDYGVLGSLGIGIPLGAKTTFIFDGRYQYGLSNVALNAAETASSFKHTDIIGFAGFMFGSTK
ncbi:MAG: outer membrane beta-barrel protein [Bdellovibrionota bacterium]